MVQKLAAVVAIKAQDRKRQLALDLAHRFHYSLRALVPDRTQLGPTRCQIGKAQAPNKISLETVATVRHRIGFHKARPALIPLVALERIWFFNQRPGLVPPRLLDRALARTGFSSRSIVAALIAPNFCLSFGASAPYSFS